MRITPVVVFLACSAAGLAGCRWLPEKHQASEAPPPPTADASSPPTDQLYESKIRPLVQKHCVGCHTEGQIAPFSLRSAAQNWERRTFIAASVAAKRMPPWGADTADGLPALANERKLSDDEIMTFQAWGAAADSGEKLDEIEDIPAPVADETAPFNMHLGMRADFFPAKVTNADEFRCFPLVDAEKGDAPSSGGLVTEFQVTPGNTQIVHHVILFAVKDHNLDLMLAQKLALDDRGGYPCFSGLELPVEQTVVAVWAPGTGPVTYPTGTGAKVDAGTRYIAQVHYSLLNSDGVVPSPDRTTIDLKIVPPSQDLQVGEWISPGITDFTLSKGQVDAELDETRSVRDWFEESQPKFKTMVFDAQVFGVLPHMHLRGRSLQLSSAALPGLKMFSAPRYNFNWQLAYFFAEPITLKSTDALRIRCHYDTMSADAPVVYGETTNAEMCFAVVFAVIKEKTQ